MEYYSAMKKNKTMSFVATWMQLEIIILSEIFVVFGVFFATQHAVPNLSCQLQMEPDPSRVCGVPITREISMLNEVNQMEKDKYCVISLLCVESKI